MSIQNPEIDIAKMAKLLIDKNSKITQKEEFVSFVKGLPSNIVQNGLVQTLAFLKGKTDDQYKKIYAILNDFFNNYFFDDPSSKKDVLEFLINDLNDISKYVFYQKYFLSFTIWLKRLVLAFKIDTGKTNN